MAQVRGWVIAVGNAFDGLHLFGSFTSREEAVEWGENQYPMQEWMIVKMWKPGKFKKPKKPKIVAVIPPEEN